jgi:hypothetical protein
MIRANPSFAWRRNRSRGTTTCARRYQPNRGNQPSRIVNRNPVRHGECIWRRGTEVAATSPPPHPTARAPSSRVWSGTSWQYPAAGTIHPVMDNHNKHTRKSLTDYFGKQKGGDLGDRLTVHSTPKHGSWLHPAEIELSLYARQCLGKRRIPDLQKLRRETKVWNRRANQKRTKI